AEVVVRLGRWLTADEAGQDLAAANRLLGFLPLAPTAESDGARIDAGFTPVADLIPPPVASDPDYDPTAERIQSALAEVLAERQSREALRWADRDLLVPHVWLVADLDSPETADLAPWLVRLHQRLADLAVEARVGLLLRNVSWGRTGDAQIEAERRLRALVEEVAGAGASGRGRGFFVVVSDRDGIGGLYTPEETGSLVMRLTDLLMLGDVAHGNSPGVERVFAAGAGDGSGSWTTQPLFIGVAAEALRWDAPALFRENAERRRLRLFAALDEPAPPTFDPAYPELKRAEIGQTGPWPKLDLPRWSPRFWRQAGAEHVRAREALDAWLAAAERWRHEMLVTHEDRRANVEHLARAVLRDYVDGLDGHTRAILADEALLGFFGPLRRLHERSAADLRVRYSELRRGGAPGIEPAPLDAMAAAPPPTDALADADDRLVEALERKINPLLLTQVAVVTFLLAWGWAIFALINLPSLPIGGVLNAAAALLTPYAPDMAAALGRFADTAWPTTPQLALWTALAIGAPIAASTVWIALRQRVALERGWKVVHDRARQWRDAAAHALTTDIGTAELALTRRNVDSARDELRTRVERLERVRELGARPPAPPEEPDPALSGRIVPAKSPPPPLTDLQVAQIVGGFRRQQADDPGLATTPERIVEALYREAARVAGDPEPDLRLELPTLRRRILAAMPREGAVRVQQLDSTVAAESAPPTVARFLAAPARVASDLRLDGLPISVVPLPVEDRFYPVVLQAGMSARRVLSLPPAPDAPDDLHRGEDAAEPPDLTPGAGESAPSATGNGAAGSEAEPDRNPVETVIRRG
ncbi:MAG: hypothetical protein IT337_17950, partial [Thermomicrobiales bacterium]|nr:hypothetical protein [Thermomicrobiales bacterium]